MKKVLIALMAFLPSEVFASNDYTKFFQYLPGATPEIVAQTRAAAAPATPLVEHSPAFPDAAPYGRQGYAPFAYSSFNSGRKESDKDAISQARKVGADLVVIVDPSFSGSTTTQIPIVAPTTSTTYTTGSATAYGPGGTVTANGNGTATTYGTTTTYLPKTTNRYNYGAVYFVKRSYIFGANWRELTDEERATLQSNSGLFIVNIVNDTPAFRSDVLAGDILVKIDDQPISGPQAATEAFARKRGQEVKVTLYRRGEFIDKTLTLGQ